ncbi:MAG: glycosyltransferase family 4 protein [Epsilonproteobacteria bacterium]|nr:glycosyltransferase family 4 protein [Campylobacterota bacterium]
MTKITHLTSAHPRFDTRIFIKMCSSLAKIENYEVNLIVADNKGDEVKNGINIFDVGKSSGRINRIFKTTQKVYQKAIELDSDIYHLHDPELIPIGLKLKKMGKKVIFDAHEDVALQILSKSYMNIILRRVLSKSFLVFEKYAFKKFDFLITATPHIRDKFLKINKKCMDINNYPKLEEFDFDIDITKKENAVCYIGSIAAVRGIKEIVRAMEFTHGIKLLLAGDFRERDVENEVKSYDGWNKVEELGFVDRTGVVNVLSRSRAGLVTLHPIINYQDALPVKMFEYMAAGLPVVATNIPLWKSIIDDAKCGICVNPFNPKEIAEAIDYIVSHPEIAKEMSKNGKKAVLEKYNWDIEEVKLFGVYKGLCK